MLYLAGQFAWFLVAAFALGGIMGWVAQTSRKIIRFWSPAWTWVAALWGVGAALAWFQLVNGRPAVWIETALLFAAAYWLGCVTGALGSVALGRPVEPHPAPAEEPPPIENEPVEEKPAESEPAKALSAEPTVPGTNLSAPDAKPAPGRRRKPKG